MENISAIKVVSIYSEMIILLIPSFKCHFKPFSRCKLCLHPMLYPINALSLAELTKNDLEKVSFDAVCFPLVLLEKK